MRVSSKRAMAIRDAITSEWQDTTKKELAADLLEARAEAQRLRDEREKIDDVWKGAPSYARYAVVEWYGNSGVDAPLLDKNWYSRTLPKSPTRLAAERLWEKIKLSDTDAVDAIAEAMEGLRGSIK